MKDSAGATAAPDDSVLGFRALIELFDGDSEAVLALLQTATGSIASDVQRIEAAALAGDAATMAEATHRLKGTSGSISATRLSAAISSLESASPRNVMFANSSTFLELNAAAETISKAVAEFARYTGSSTGTK